MDTNVLAAILAPILTCIAVVLGHLFGRRAGLRQADAAVTDAEASARHAVTADWKSFSDALQTRLSAVESRSAATEVRLDAAEERATAAEMRAGHAENLYKAAMKYLRLIATWFDDKWPGEKMPPPPEELAGEL